MVEFTIVSKKLQLPLYGHTVNAVVETTLSYLPLSFYAHGYLTNKTRLAVCFQFYISISMLQLYEWLWWFQAIGDVRKSTYKIKEWMNANGATSNWVLSIEVCEHAITNDIES